MQTAWSVVAGLSALGLGYGLGSVRNLEATRARGNELSDPSSVVTYQGTAAEKAKGKSGQPVGETFGILAFKTYAEAGDRLDELLKEYAGFLPNRQYTSPLQFERVIEEIEHILALASEADLITFLEQEVFVIRPTVPGQQNPLAEIAFGHLAKLSPSRAAEFGMRHWEVEKEEFDGLHSLIREWNKRNPAEVERWIEGLEAPSLKEFAFHSLLLNQAVTGSLAILSRLSEIDPEKGYGIAATLGYSLAPEELVRTAEGLLSQIKDSAGKEKLLAPFLAAWGTRDPEAMMTWLFAQDFESLGPSFVEQSLQSLAHTDPSGFLAKVSPELKHKPSLGSVANLAWWQWLIAEEGTTASIQWIGENPDIAALISQTGPRYLSGEKWDPDRANEILAALAVVPDSAAKANFSQNLIAQLSQSHPKAVLAYAMEHLPIGSQSEMTISQVIGNWAAKGEPEEAIQWSLENLNSDHSRVRAVSQAMSRWAGSDPPAATAFAMNLPEKERNAALASLGYEWQARDPEGVIAFLKESPDPDVVSALTQNSFRNLSEYKSGETYFPKALAMPAGKMRHDAVRGLFGGWAQSDAKAAIASIEEVPEGTLRDAAILGFNGSASRQDPKQVLELATRISVPATRDKEIISRGRNWLRQDEASASAAIRANGALSEAVKAEIFKKP